MAQPFSTSYFSLGLAVLLLFHPILTSAQLGQVEGEYQQPCKGQCVQPTRWQRGSGRLQAVNEEGENVFDEELQEGQLIVVRQAYAVVKKAGQQGFEYISFRTNDQAMISQLAGRLSVMRGLPDDVVMNAYDVSRKEEREIKYNREEFTVLSPQEGRGLSLRD